MHNEFGASPRYLGLYANRLSDYESHLHHEIGWVRDPLSAFLDPTSYSIVTIEPSPTSRFSFVTTARSRRVFELFWKRRLNYETRNTLYLYDYFRENPISAAAAGWIFELSMHEMLKKGQIIQLFPVLGRRKEADLIYDNYAASNGRNNPTSLQLTRSEEYPFIEGHKLRRDRYYRVESTNSAVHSLLLIRPPGELPILLIFRMIHDQGEYDANMDGLLKINDSNVSPKARRCCVVVTPENFHPEIKVPMEYFGDKGRQMPPDEVFRVFHCPVSMNKLFGY